MFDSFGDLRWYPDYGADSNSEFPELMAYTIEERFRSIMEQSPHLLNRVSNKDRASYLRINPTNFSKLLSIVRL